MEGDGLFYMVRIYWAVPIVHNNTELLATGEYNGLYRAKLIMYMITLS